MVDIQSIDDNTWRFTDGEISFYLLRGSERALFIDGGWRRNDLHSLAGHIVGDLNLSLVNTSCVSTLLGGNDEFSRFYMSPSDGFIYHNMLDKVGIIKPVFDGDIIDLGGRELEVISFPGITPGSVVILDYLSGAVFGGLSLTDGIIDMTEDYSDIHAYLMSLRRMDNYRGKYDVIYPVSGRCEVSPSILPRLEKTVRGIIRREMTGEEKDGRTIYSDGFVTFALPNGGKE